MTDETSAEFSSASSGLRGIGPAIIVASVVLGPGSIFTSSNVGNKYGYSMAWVLVVAGLLMVGMVALAGRLGVLLKGTICDELSTRLGRPVAAIIGIVLVYGISIYNSLVNLKHAVAKHFANIEVLLKQRHDELPKLVATCKQYMEYEGETLEKVIFFSSTQKPLP